MEKQKYLDDLHDIKTIMDRSSRFISLSGLSGVIAGVAALVGAYIAYETIYSGQDYLDYRINYLSTELVLQLLVIASSVLLVSLAGGLYFTQKTAKKNV